MRFSESNPRFHAPLTLLIPLPFQMRARVHIMLPSDKNMLASAIIREITIQFFNYLKNNMEDYVCKSGVCNMSRVCLIATSLSFRLNLSNLTDVTLPTEVSSHTLKSKLNEKILNGEYNIG